MNFFRPKKLNPSKLNLRVSWPTVDRRPEIEIAAQKLTAATNDEQLLRAVGELFNTAEGVVREYGLYRAQIQTAQAVVYSENSGY